MKKPKSKKTSISLSVNWVVLETYHVIRMIMDERQAKETLKDALKLAAKLEKKKK